MKFRITHGDSKGVPEEGPGEGSEERQLAAGSHGVNFGGRASGSSNHTLRSG